MCCCADAMSDSCGRAYRAARRVLSLHKAMWGPVTVSFAGLIWGLKCVHMWYTHEFWVVGMLHVVCATMGMQCIGGCGRACMAVHRAAGPAQGHVGGGWLCVAHGCGVRVQMCVGDPAWQWYVSCGAVVGFVCCHVHAMYWWLWRGTKGCTQGCRPWEVHEGFCVYQSLL